MSDEVIIQRFAKFYGFLPSQAFVLDAGCGMGRFDVYLRKKGFRVVGIDYSEQMVSKAKELVSGVEFLKMDIRNLKFDEDLFDGILNFGVLPHIEKRDLTAVLSESYRVLKSGGIIFLATKSAEKEKTIVEQAIEGGAMKVTYYTLETIKNALNKSNFKIIDAYEMQDDLGRPFNYMYVYAQAIK